MIRRVGIVTGLAALALVWFVLHRHPPGDDTASVAPRTSERARSAVQAPPATSTATQAAPRRFNVIEPLPDHAGGMVREAADTAAEEQAAAARVLDELQWLIKASAIAGVAAHVEGTEIVISGTCDLALLRNLGDTLVSFQLDPGRSYSGLRCANTVVKVTLQ